MAPSIIGSSFTGTLGSSLSDGGITMKLPFAGSAGGADGLIMAVVTNNGTFPWWAKMKSNGEMWLVLENSTYTGLGKNGEQFTVTYFLYPYPFNQLSQNDQLTWGPDEIDIVFSASPDGVTVGLLEITGCNFVGFLIDRGVINGPVVFAKADQANSVKLNYSTATWDTLSIATIISDDGALGGAVPVGFTGIGSAHIWGTNFIQMAMGYKQNVGSAVPSGQFSWEENVSMFALELAFTNAAGYASGATVQNAVQSAQYAFRKSKLISPVIGR